jgi:hypothetical protein
MTSRPLGRCHLERDLWLQSAHAVRSEMPFFLANSMTDMYSINCNYRQAFCPILAAKIQNLADTGKILFLLLRLCKNA